MSDFLGQDQTSKGVARSAAAEALGNLGIKNQAVIDALRNLLRDSEWYIRLSAIKSLTHMNHQPIDTCITLIEGGDVSEMRASHIGLLRAQPEDYLPYLDQGSEVRYLFVATMYFQGATLSRRAKQWFLNDTAVNLTSETIEALRSARVRFIENIGADYAGILNRLNQPIMIAQTTGVFLEDFIERDLPEEFTVTNGFDMQMRMQAVESNMTRIGAHEARLAQVDARIEEIKIQSEQAQREIEDAIALQCLKQIWIERQIAGINAQVKELREDLITTNERVAIAKVDIQNLEARSEEWVGNLARQVDTLGHHTEVMEGLSERMEQKLEELRTLFNGLEQRMKERWSSIIASMSIEDVDCDLSPTERAYVKKFKYLLVQMHIVAMTATEGTMQLSSSNTASMALMVLNIVSGMAPGPLGAPIQAVFGYLFQTMDERNTRQRMGQIAQLGTEPGDIARLATTLSQRLIHCFALEHQTKKGSLTRLFSMTQDIINSFTEHGFYGALFDAVQGGDVLMPLREGVRQLSIPEVEERAEQDAKLLLAGVIKDGVPKSTDVIDINRLFLYAAPTLTVIDRLFLTILESFCAAAHCELNRISVGREKRQRFYGQVAKGFHLYAERVSAQIEHSQEIFVERLAGACSAKRHTDGTTGVFYFKPGLFQASTKHHASVRSQALETTEIEAVLTAVLN